MYATLRRCRALLLTALLCAPAAAQALVSVGVSGDSAVATISLTDGVHTYDAVATIDFDTPLNLTPASLNLTAQIVTPASLVGRLPLGVQLDTAFPVMITVEPPAFDWIFSSSMDGPETGTGVLTFRNEYQVEVHTGNLTWTPGGPYRLFKAPVGGAFTDVTNDVLNGSVRARGRGGSFSQFLVVKDNRALLGVALAKIAALDARILAATLTDVLRADLLGLLANVNSALLILDLDAAIASLDALIAEIDANAGTGPGQIANLWRATHDLVNDAGEMDSLAHTLRFTLVRLQGGP